VLKILNTSDSQRRELQKVIRKLQQEILNKLTQTDRENFMIGMHCATIRLFLLDKRKYTEVIPVKDLKEVQTAVDVIRAIIATRKGYELVFSHLKNIEYLTGAIPISSDKTTATLDMKVIGKLSTEYAKMEVELERLLQES
jgi:hypothetical protein